MPNLNINQSIVDLFKSKGLDPSFESRKRTYEQLGLQDVLGDYRGSPEQNPAFIRKLQETNPPSPLPVLSTDDVTPKTVIDETTPKTTTSIYDLFPDIFAGAKAETKEATAGLEGTLSRAAVTIPKAISGLKTEAEARGVELAGKGERLKAQVGEKAAGFGGAFSGVTQKSQAEIAQEVAFKQAGIERKLGADIYNRLSTEEKQFGTKFLESLSIPEAEQFTKLPAPVRGAVIVAYENAITKAERTAFKDAQTALNRLGYQVVGDQIVPTFARERYEVEEPRREAREERAIVSSERAAKASERSEARFQEFLEKTTEEKEAGGFTTSQINKGIATAGVPKGDFATFDFESKNYFINNADTIESVKKILLTFKENNKKLDKEDNALEARTDLPPEVRNHLRRFLITLRKKK